MSDHTRKLFQYSITQIYTQDLIYFCSRIINNWNEFIFTLTSVNDFKTPLDRHGSDHLQYINLYSVHDLFMDAQAKAFILPNTN